MRIRQKVGFSDMRPFTRGRVALLEASKRFGASWSDMFCSKMDYEVCRKTKKGERWGEPPEMEKALETFRSSIMRLKGRRMEFMESLDAGSINDYWMAEEAFNSIRKALISRGVYVGVDGQVAALLREAGAQVGGIPLGLWATELPGEGHVVGRVEHFEDGSIMMLNLSCIAQQVVSDYADSMTMAGGSGIDKMAAGATSPSGMASLAKLVKLAMLHRYNSTMDAHGDGGAFEGQARQTALHEAAHILAHQAGGGLWNLGAKYNFSSCGEIIAYLVEIIYGDPLLSISHLPFQAASTSHNSAARSIMSGIFPWCDLSGEEVYAGRAANIVQELMRADLEEIRKRAASMLDGIFMKHFGKPHTGVMRTSELRALAGDAMELGDLLPLFFSA